MRQKGDKIAIKVIEYKKNKRGKVTIVENDEKLIDISK